MPNMVDRGSTEAVKVLRVVLRVSEAEKVMTKDSKFGILIVLIDAHLQQVYQSRPSKVCAECRRTDSPQV